MNIKTFQIILAFFPIIYCAQSPDLRPNLSGMVNDHNNLRDYANNWKNNTNRSIDMDELKKNTAGTPYFDDKFKKAQLIDGTPVPNELRYNAFSDQMEFMKDGVTYEVNKLNGLKIKFPATNTTYIVKPLIKDNKETLSYFNELRSGKFSLLEKKSIKLTGGTGVNNGLVNNTGQSFSPLKDELYISTNDTLILIPKNTKDLSKQFSEMGIDLGEFLQSKKVNLKNTADLTALVDFLNKNR